jgi:hypothetical protein
LGLYEMHVGHKLTLHLPICSVLLVLLLVSVSAMGKL